MNAAQRREKILQQLHGASAPISASALAAKLGVSRQIVVGDVAPVSYTHLRAHET